MTVVVCLFGIDPRSLAVVMVGGMGQVIVIEMKLPQPVVVIVGMMNVRHAGEEAESQPERATSDCQYPTHNWNSSLSRG